MKQNAWFFVISLTSLLFLRLVSSAPAKDTNIFGSRTPKIIFEYSELVRQSPQFEVTTLETVKYNRSTAVLNAEFVIHDKIVMNYKAWIDGYQQFGMEHIYRRSAIALHCSFCELISGSYLLNRGMSLYGNMPSKCPFKVGQLYYMHNFNLQDSSVIAFPGYKWRMDFQIGLEGKKDTNETGLIRIYFKVERPGHKTPV